MVRAPCRRGAPVEDSAGIRPKHFLSSLGGSKRVKSPMAATMVTATGKGTPRRAWRALPTGCKRPTCPWAGSACSRRWRRSVASGMARTSSGKTLCCAAVGQTTSESHRRGAGPQGARPASRIACRSKKAVRRHVAAVRWLLGSARARGRSRLASSSTLGTETRGRAPERARRASGTASRRVVVTRAPDFWGSSAGATPQQ